MKTELTFFGDRATSSIGLKRGLVVFASIGLLDTLWFTLTKNIYEPYVTKKKISKLVVVFIWIILCSALSVQLTPADYKEAIVYGSLVGFVVYGVYNATAYTTQREWQLYLAILDTAWGVTMCGVASLIKYYVFS
jgi:uncharacterized membrane protein